MDTINEVKKQEVYIEKIKEINKGKTLKYHILTMGCQLNENDSEKLCGMLENMGYVKKSRAERSGSAVIRNPEIM